MASLSDLRTKVAANTSVITDAIVAIQALKQKLDEVIAENDPAALQALSDALETADSALVAALAASAVPAPAPVPPGNGPPEEPNA